MGIWRFCAAGASSLVLAMPTPLERVVAGGQTGVDQAALAVAHEVGLATGGWCPPGYVDEKGPIGPLAETWHLKALPADVWEEHRGFFESLKLSFNNTDIWAQRTLMNVLDSSGTLTILPEATTDHTNLGIDATMAMKKPLLVLRSFDPHEGTFTKWLQDNNVQVLNINGPRESSIPGINAESKVLFERLFRRALH